MRILIFPFAASERKKIDHKHACVQNSDIEEEIFRCLVLDDPATCKGTQTACQTHVYSTEKALECGTEARRSKRIAQRNTGMPHKGESKTVE